MKKKVWIISELFYPETISTGYIMTEIAKHLSNCFEVNVICGPEFYEEKKDVKKHPILQDIKIHRINNKGYNKNNFFSRLLGHLKVTFQMFFLMRNIIPKGSTILLVTNPVLLVPLTAVIKKTKEWNIKLFIHDVYPDNLLISRIIKSKKSLSYKILNSIFNSAYKKMNNIVVCGRDMKEIYAYKVKNSNKISIIENWADVDNIEFSYQKSTKLNFLFAGNLGRLQGLDSLLEAIKPINNVNFTFIGSGVMKEYIVNFIENNKSKNIKLLDWLPREEQNEFLTSANVGLISLKKGMYGLGVPSKLYNLLASGKPIFYIGDINSEIDLVIKENEIGWFAEAGNVEMIRNTILEIIGTDFVQMKELSNNCRKIAENKYSKQLILDKINKLFN